ncbi:divalent-cation tolerance protein CutA [Nocardia amikacinitolerans]|uniref:divalent-cation tolerance protein CutA n=1 Tax=Nocardia amikacinitolerans TaxID=756689 RepID=UPI0020A5034C|nr:divalent-cation tolerance protein CutA [Nocardia amikacinitolerans]MCP2281059.1 divalent cation tolerance protein [Nocardia amikacinitolerans]
MAQAEIVAVTITAGDADWLTGFAKSLIERRLAACGNVVPSIRSVYRWEGEVQQDAEALLVLHTRRSLVESIVEVTNDEHPYDTPQVVALPIVSADSDYRQWVIESTLGYTPRED